MKNSKEANRAELLHVSKLMLFKSLLERYKTWEAPVGTLVLRTMNCRSSLNQIVWQFGIASAAQQTCKTIYDTLVDFHQGAPQYDDVALRAVRRHA